MPNFNATDYKRIEKAIVFLTRNYQEKPGLETLARHLQLSPFHLQRLFQRWAGISPKQFMGYLTLKHAKTMLTESKNILDTAMGAGLSGPGRLHDLFITMEAMTPGEFKAKGEGLTLTYGIHPTRFGPCLIATTPRGICHLSFDDALNKKEAEKELLSRWKNIRLEQDQKKTALIIKKIFGGNREKVKLFLKGTNFQIKVWEALMKIPGGSVVSYEDLAVSIKKPTASRAVSRAVATNNISFLIPCHRVIHKSGIMEGYRWGSNRKKAILLWESARLQ